MNSFLKLYSLLKKYTDQQVAIFGQTKEVISPLKASGLHKTKPSKAKAQKNNTEILTLLVTIASFHFSMLEYSEIWQDLAVRSKNLISRINCCLRGIVAGLPIPFPPHNLRQLRVLPICHNPSFLCLKNAPQFHLIYHKKHL